MTGSEKPTLEQVLKETDSELAGLIRNSIVSFQSQQHNGIEITIGYICETNEATIMIAIQKNN